MRWWTINCKSQVNLPAFHSQNNEWIHEKNRENETDELTSANHHSNELICEIICLIAGNGNAKDDLIERISDKYAIRKMTKSKKKRRRKERHKQKKETEKRAKILKNSEQFSRM